MKILLTNPNFEGIVYTPSLGLGFMATYLKEHSDWDVEVIEPILERINEKEILNKVKGADILGLICYTESRFQVFDFARKAKEANPDCKIIVGGPHVFALDEAILEHYPFVDAVIKGEGEETVLDVVKGKPFGEILGLTWRKNSGEIIKNLDRLMIKDIDNLHYDYSLVFSELAGWKDFEISPELLKLNALPIIASRGCPFRCAFCAANQQWSQMYRYLSPEELVKRMQELISRYKIQYFRFFDALFIGSEERMIKFCELLEKAKLDIHFRIDIRVGTSRDILARLRKVGCDVVGFGVESGSDRILKRVRKGITRKGIEETIRICKELGYWTIGFFMIALPDETIKDINKTFELFKFFDEINVQFFKIHPNTAFYNELKQKGEIDDEIWFNPNYGFNTRYGNEIYYCKELFPSAGFFREDVERMLQRSAYSYNIGNPETVIRKHGLAKGIIFLILSALADVLLKFKMGGRFYYKLQRANAPKMFYRWLIKRK